MARVSHWHALRDLISTAFRNEQYRDNHNRLVATTTDIIAEARTLSNREIRPSQIHQHVEQWCGAGAFWRRLQLTKMFTSRLIIIENHVDVSCFRLELAVFSV
ncbi:hypothetical protein CS369_09920 [Candidatus Symbiopectobacterium sp. 'North America']|nr:hypothetical protein [Candidatus Symbiopectobacterium sp. 'North America']